MDVVTPVAPSLSIDLLFFITGLCVGSFLNVVALRSLAEQSVLWPPSQCPNCHHRLSPLDNIPLISWLSLGGKCRYCRAPIHWQYPVVELLTGLSFVAIQRAYLDFGNSPFNNEYWQNLLQSFRLPLLFEPGTYSPEIVWLYIGFSLYLVCTLIAVSVTDFREKLIPHEITYPAILIGILFSALVRHDLLGAMAGIGASYILFDFIAFYGLKVYLYMHGGMEDEPGRPFYLRRRLRPRRRRRLNRALRWRLDLATLARRRGQGDDEPLEVMGGGDAVLSAVMAAFLGWQLLVVALVIGFIAGTFMGLALLLIEMRRANLLHKCARNSLLWATAGATVFGCLGFIIDNSIGQGISSSAAPLAALGAIGGLMLGIVSVGTSVSKPYPFGPALALGGFIAIFLLPNWLYLSASVPTPH